MSAQKNEGGEGFNTMAEAFKALEQKSGPQKRTKEDKKKAKDKPSDDGARLIKKAGLKKALPETTAVPVVVTPPSVPEAPERVADIAPITAAPAPIAEAPVLRPASKLFGARGLAAQKHFESLVMDALNGKIKLQLREPVNGKQPCSIHPEHEASKERFIVFAGKMYPVSDGYAKAAVNLFDKLKDKADFRRDGTGRLIMVMGKEKAREKMAADMEAEQKRADNAEAAEREFAAFVEEVKLWLEGLQAPGMGYELPVDPVGGYKSSDLVAEYEDGLRDLRDPFDQSPITSVLIFGTTAGDRETEGPDGKPVMLKGVRLFRAEFVGKRTAAALHKTGAAVYSLYEGKSNKLTLDGLFAARRRFFPNK